MVPHKHNITVDKVNPENCDTAVDLVVRGMLVSEHLRKEMDEHEKEMVNAQSIINSFDDLDKKRVVDRELTTDEIDSFLDLSDIEEAIAKSKYHAIMKDAYWHEIDRILKDLDRMWLMVSKDPMGIEFKHSSSSYVHHVSVSLKRDGKVVYEGSKLDPFEVYTSIMSLFDINGRGFACCCN